MNQDFDPRLKGFLQRLLDQAINAAIQGIFWKMPLVMSIIVLALLIGIALYFKMY